MSRLRFTLLLCSTAIISTPVMADASLDELKAKLEKAEKENKDLLTDTDYPAPDAKQKELSKDYSADAHDHEVVKNSYRSNFKIAGGSPVKAKTTNELPMGKTSPMTKLEKRPKRPPTGNHPKG